MNAIDLPEWAVERGRVLNDFSALEADRTVLLNIDMQNVFVAPGQVFANPNALDVIDNINALSAAMRAIGAPVIWTRQTHTFVGPCAPPPWQYDLADPRTAAGIAALQSGAEGQALHPAMDVAAGDIVIDKYRYGAFSCPAGHLARTLAALDTAMVIVAGTLTNLCCETTAREANLAGYKVIFVADATAAITDAEHNAALLNLRISFADVRLVSEVLAMIEAARVRA